MYDEMDLIGCCLIRKRYIAIKSIGALFDILLIAELGDFFLEQSRGKKKKNHLGQARHKS